MKSFLFLPLLLSNSLSAQLQSDSHWFYDDTDHRGEPFAMLASDTHLYVGGLLINAGGIVNEENLTRYNFATESWEEVPGLNNGVGGRVDDIFSDSEGFFYFGGNFALPANTDAQHIVRFDPNTEIWEALFDPSSNLTNPDWDNGPSDGRVLAIARSGDIIFIGGEFTDGDNPPEENFILQYRLGSEGVSNGVWESVGEGTEARVDDLLVLPNGDLIAATRTDDGLRRWDGSTWTTFGGGVDNFSGGNGVVRTMALHLDGRLFIGGNFTAVGSTNLPVRGVAAYNPATDTWDDLAGGFGPDIVQDNGTTFMADGVFDIEVDSEGRIYVGGDIQSSVAGPFSDASKVAFWNDTGMWNSMGSGFGSSGSQIVNCLEVDANDRVYAGGLISRGWEFRSGDTDVAWWDADEELSVIPSSAESPVLRIEDGMIVMYARRGEESQFRVREGDTLPLSASDNRYGPFGYPAAGGITRRELTDFEPDEPNLFFQIQFGL